jgi:hypothetical protein
VQSRHEAAKAYREKAYADILAREGERVRDAATRSRSAQPLTGRPVDDELMLFDPYDPEVRYELESAARESDLEHAARMRALRRGVALGAVRNFKTLPNLQENARARQLLELLQRRIGGPDRGRR